MINAYLDSHHISRIAEGISVLKRHFGVDLNLYFSQSHVIEALPKDTSRIDDLVARLRFITDPQGVGLLPWSKVLELEAIQEGKLSLDQIRCPISEILFYGLDASEFGKRSHWLNYARSLLDEQLAKIPDLNQRRSMRAKFFKRGKFSPVAIEMLRQQQKTALDSVSKSLPEMFPLFEKGGMYDLLCGKVSEQRYSTIFMKVVSDPIVLANLASHPEFDSIMNISKILWNETDQIAERISTLVQGLVEIQTNVDLVPFRRLRAEVAKVLRTDSFRIRIASILTNQNLSVEKLSKLPATSLFVSCMIQYVFDKIDTYASATSPNFARKINFKRSDFADLTHLVYSPYLDIFGCDSEMRERVRKLGYQTNKFVTTDADFVRQVSEVRTLLSKRIEQQLVPPSLGHQKK